MLHLHTSRLKFDFIKLQIRGFKSLYKRDRILNFNLAKKNELQIDYFSRFTKNIRSSTIYL